MEEITVLIVEDSEQMRESLRKTVELEQDMAVIGEAGDGTGAIELAEQLDPSVILMDINMPKLDGISATSEIVRQLGTSVVIISVEGEHEYFRRAMQAGACDFLVKPFTAGDVISAVRRAHRMHQRRQTALPSVGRVITVFGGKGGVGKTTLVGNLAVALAGPGKRSLVVDLDLEFGDSPRLFNASPTDDLGTVWASGQPVTPDLVQRAALSVADNVDLISAPARFDQLSDLLAGLRERGDFVERVLRCGQQLYDHVLVDVPGSFREETMLALDCSDLVVVVTTQELAALHNTGKVLSVLVDRIGYERERLKLVVNRYDGQLAVTIKDIAEGLGHPVYGSIPCNWKVGLWAANLGNPVVLNRRGSDLSRGLREIADKLSKERPAVVDGEKVNGHAKSVAL